MEYKLRLVNVGLGGVTIRAAQGFKESFKEKTCWKKTMRTLGGFATNMLSGVAPVSQIL